MAGERKFTRIPPESTGDRVYMIHTAEIEYKTFNSVPSGTTNHVWQVGERYDIAGFGGDGKVHIHGVYDRQDGTGILSVHYNKTAKYENLVPTADASISYESEGAVAQVSSFYDTYIPAQNIMGYDNPEYGWDIDRFGSGRVTFYEGNPQITGMGSLKVNDSNLLASYDFSKSKLPGEFVNSREGGSEVTNTWDSTTRGVKLAVGTTSGDRVTHTSNLFHSHEEGSSMLFVMATRSGDTGKEFVARNWGAFDATDGFFFQIKGSDDAPGGRTSPATPAVGTGPGSALRVVHRFTFNGGTNNHEILQKEWNQDTLLGTGNADNPSGIKLDVSKINTYWIDYQFIGGGRTRWGIFYQGDRIVCHEMYHHNGIGVGTQNHNPITNPNRPMCWAMANYGTAGSSSEFYAYGGGVFIEAVTDPLRSSQQISKAWDTKHWGQASSEPYWRTKQSKNGSNTSYPALLKSGSYSGTTSTQYHGSLSPIQFLANGDENHSVYQPLAFEVSSYNIKTGASVPVEVRLFYGCINRGFEFSSANISCPTVVVDEEADHLAHLREIGQFVVQGDGLFRFDLLSDNFQYGTVRNLSDQKIARALHPIADWKSGQDYYSTGNESVVITMGADPVYGESKHYFADCQPVAIRQTDGDQTLSEAFTTATTFTNVKTVGGAGYASVDQVDNPNDWHYLSYVTRDRAWLYSSQADINDDRLTRMITVDSASAMDLGDTLTITSGSHTAKIMKISVDTANAISASAAVNGTEYQIVTVGNTDYTGNVGAARSVPGEIFTATATAPTGTGTIVATSNSATLAIVGRSSSQSSYAGAFTTSGGGAGTISSVSTDASLAKDYWTSLNALTYTDLGMDADEDITTGLALYANPNPRAAWTFMAKHLDNTTEDADGDALATDWDNVRLNWSIYWREREQ